MKGLFKALSVVALFATMSVGAAEAVKFRAPTIAQSHAMYAIVNALYVRKDNPDLVAFEDMLADAWINTHKQEALEKAAKKHLQQADPEDVWEMPYANDWVGCINLQFDDPKIFSQARFATYTDQPTLFGWINTHKAELAATPELVAFAEKLRQLPEWGGQCENIVRDQPPHGSLSV